MLKSGYRKPELTERIANETWTTGLGTLDWRIIARVDAERLMES